MRRTIRHLLILVTAIAAATTAVAAAPTSASAAGAPTCLHDRVTLDYCATTYASPRYKGWTYLESTCPPEAYCFYAGSINTWTWDGRAWSRSRLNAAQWVYVYPYSGEWRWVWTQKSGWQATTEGRFVVR